MTYKPVITSVAHDKEAFIAQMQAAHAQMLAVADTNTAPFAKKLIAEISERGSVDNPASSRLNISLLTLSPTPQSPMLIPDETAIGRIFIAAAELGLSPNVSTHRSLDPKSDTCDTTHPGAMLAVGSGSICDLVRYVATRLGIPYYIMATAASMDGYTSSVTAPIIDNLKQTFQADAPKGVLTDPEIYTDAPSVLTAAGFGDIMGKFTSVCDWEMEELICPDPRNFCQQLANDMRKLTQECFAAKTAKSIMDALVDSGLIMQKCGHSRAASGSEHHLSHFWEMKALDEGKPPVLHGAKVGVATIAVLMSHQWLLDEELTQGDWDYARTQVLEFDRESWENKLYQIYGNTAQELLPLWSDDVTQTRIKQFDNIQKHWPKLMEILAQNAGLAAPVIETIKAIGGPVTPQELGISRENFVAGVLYANRLRKRFSTWRLLEIIGLLPVYAERLALRFYG